MLGPWKAYEFAKVLRERVVGVLGGTLPQETVKFFADIRGGRNVRSPPSQYGKLWAFGVGVTEKAALLRLVFNHYDWPLLNYYPGISTTLEGPGCRV